MAAAQDERKAVRSLHDHGQIVLEGVEFKPVPTRYEKVSVTRLVNVPTRHLAGHVDARRDLAKGRREIEIGAHAFQRFRCLALC